MKRGRVTFKAKGQRPPHGHGTRVTYGYVKKWYARCRCGWVGGTNGTEGAARDEAAAHIEGRRAC